MTSDQRYDDLPSIQKKSETRAAEHLLSLLKAGLATAPFCGGIASLISDYIPSAKQKRLEGFTIGLAERLTALQDRVNDEVVLTDEFAFLFEKCFRGVSENYQSEKLLAYRAILVNSLVGSDVQDDEKEYFVGLVNSFSTLHIRLLKFMANPTEYLLAHEISPTTIRGGFSDFFPVAIPDVNIEVIKSAFGDLYQHGLINTDKKMFHTMTSGQGLDLLGNRITPYGRQFISFVTDSHSP